MPGLRSWVKNALLRQDTVLSRPPGQFNVAAYKLQAIKRRGLDIKFAVDGGAADGAWTEEFLSVYPEAQVLCIEPRRDAQEELQKLATQRSGIHVSDVLLGPNEGQATYNESDVQSSILNDGEGMPFGRVATATMSTLDRLIEQRQLPWPDLIKLDLQGYELEALRGGTKCLENAQAVLLEVSFIRLQSAAPIAHEVMAFMHAHGFVTYDIFSLWHRPLDGALAQGDFLFLKHDHPLLRDRRWSAGE